MGTISYRGDRRGGSQPRDHELCNGLDSENDLIIHSFIGLLLAQWARLLFGLKVDASCLPIKKTFE